MSYKIIEEIGRGGMGCVYKAMDANGNLVALKMMSNKVTYMPEYCRLFDEEVEALRKMNSSSVVRIVGDPYDDEDGNKYLPMEYIDGETIDHIVKNKGPFNFHEAVELMIEILEAMDHIHSHDIIHRDIKPSNVMVRSGNNVINSASEYYSGYTRGFVPGRICIIDFGIAKDAKIGHTGRTVGRIIGTDGYMSPEQAGGLNIDSRTDIYSLGCLFYLMITGLPAVPTGANDHETICNIFKHIPVLPSQAAPGVPVAIDEVIKRAVDKDMTKRFQTVKAFKEALEMATGLATPKVTVGRSVDNDIIMEHDDVSRRHLNIFGCTGNNIDGTPRFYVELEDVGSTNGTGVNGRLLKKDKISIDYNGTVNYPDVFLAGRPELSLDWGEVMSKLREKGWKPVSLPPPPPSSASDDLSVAMALLSFFVPVVGWVVAAQNSDTLPNKARKANIFAWAGLASFAVVVQTTIILLLIFL